MIDLELERKAFEELSYKNGVRNFTKDDIDGGYCSAELDYNWHIWIKSAESKQAEIESLKAQLAKIESGEFVVVPKSKLNTCYWDEANNGVGYYELFNTLEEAKKAAAHYKATIKAAQENSHE